MTKPFILSDLDEPTYFMQNTLSIDMDKAYIKQEFLNNESVWSIYNGQGEKMGKASSREVAFAVANQNELIGLSVH